MSADGTVRSIPALAQWAAARYGDADAVVDGDTRLTFRQLAVLAHQATRGAMALGIRPGDRVAIWAPNSWEWIVAALGALGAGGWLVPVNTRFKGEEAAYVLERADAAAMFTVRGFLDADYVAMLRDTAPHLRCLDHVVFLAGAEAGERTFDEYLADGDSVDPADVDARIAALRPDDVADVIFTSGTTGRPKGVMLEHGASLLAFDRWAHRFGLRHGDRYLIVNPFFHCFGYKAGWMACLQQGATAFPMAALDLDRLLTLVSSERVSALPGPPTLFSSLLDAREGDADLSSLRIGFVGASTVPPELLRRIRAELPFESLTTGYGLTECTAMVSITRPDAEPEHVAYWNGGYPLDGIEVAIADDDEILVRGFNVMRGYYDDPEATARAIDRDGWLHTGDIGMRADDGALRISDRKKDIYISGGFNVSPAEVENLLLGFDVISQVAVVGIPDPRLGEVGVAIVVPRPGASTSPEEVIAWAREHVANYKVPRRVELVSELPLNASGKVLKGELRARLSEERGDVIRRELHIDVTGAVHHDEPLQVSVTVVAPAVPLPPRPFVVIAIPGGTYHRRYWDLHPPGRTGFSQAEFLAERGVVVVACDYLGGGDSSRPDDGDFIGLEVQADAAHGVFEHVRDSLVQGTLVDGLPPVAVPTFVGIGQSLGGFITMIQQGKYDDYPAIGIFGASPLLIANTREQPEWVRLSAAERRAWIIEQNARQAGQELRMYHGAPREQYRGIFHVKDVPDDLFAYDEAECHTLIPRNSGIDGMTPGFAQPFADRIASPIFLAFGEIDISADPRAEPTGYPGSPDITLVVVPQMAHMHNFAETRAQLWQRFYDWLPVTRA